MSYEFIHPSIEDAPYIYQLAQQTPQLDSYPEYFYLLWCRDFKNTSLIVKKNNYIEGFIIGYMRPNEPSTLLIWQQAMDKRILNKGVGIKLLHKLTNTCKALGTKHIEATISPENKSAERTLIGISRLLDTNIEKKEIFSQSHFNESHHEEILVRVGPFEETQK